MIFKLNIDRECREEIIANVHERTPLIDEIEKLVTQEGTAEQLTGYTEDEIVMLQVRVLVVFEGNFRIPALDCDQFSIAPEIISLDDPVLVVVGAHLRCVSIP